MLRKQLIRWAPDGQGDSDPAGDGQQQGGQPATWDAYLETLPAEVKTLYDNHVTGLQNTVKATRDERDEFKGKLQEITQALDGKKPEEAVRLLGEMTSQLDTANKRIAFLEEAGKSEIGCSNPGAAWLMAQAGDLFDRRGNPDWEAIKQAAPELFKKTAPAGNAGAGTGSRQEYSPTSMDEFIRKSAGIRS